MSYDVPVTDEWTEESHGLVKGGDVGGDIQASESWSRQFARRLSDGTFEVATFYTYVATEDGRTWIQTMAGWQTCTDIAEFNDSETSGTYRFWDETPPADAPLVTEQDAQQRCAALGAADIAQLAREVA